MRIAIEWFSVIKRDEDFRIDADFYSHPYREKIDNLKNRLFFSTLGAETKFIGSGHTPYKHDVKMGDTPFITVECVGDLDFFFSKTKRINRDQYHSEYKNKTIRKGAVVCTIKRRICKSYPFLSEPQTMAFNQDVALIYPNSKLQSGFLSVYLNCSYGQGLADSLKTEQMNPYISLVNLAKLPVPILDKKFQERIDAIVITAQKIKSESEQKYQQAQNLLLTELGLNDWQPRHQLTFIKNFSDTREAGRIDAEYFQPKYDEIVGAIKAYQGGWDTLGRLCQLIGHPSNPPYADTKEKDKTFIVTQKHLGDFLLNDNFWQDKEALYTTNEFANKNKQYILKNNDVLLYSVGAYIGKANIFSGKIKATIGSFITLLRTNPEKLNPYFLMAFLNTDIGITISKTHQRGMAQQYLYPYDIKAFPIPLLSQAKQQKIQQKVTESFELRKHSKQLLENAKRAVEMAIEEDENTAIQWLEA